MDNDQAVVKEYIVPTPIDRYDGCHFAGNSIFAARSVFFNGHKWINDKIEYDPDSDEFIAKINTAWEQAEKYSKLVVENEDIWLAFLEETDAIMLPSAPRFCGFSDIDNDQIPEFVVYTDDYGTVGLSMM